MPSDQQIATLQDRVAYLEGEVKAHSALMAAQSSNWKDLQATMHGTPHAPGMLSEMISMKRTLNTGVKVLSAVAVAVLGDVAMRMLETFGGGL